MPDVHLRLGNVDYLCDVTVVDTLAESNLQTAATGPGKLAEKAARSKVRKYADTQRAMEARHHPFAVETMGGLSDSALNLIREIHNTAGSHCTWRDADVIGGHLLKSVAIAVQSCSGMALRMSLERQMVAALGGRAA